MKPYPFSIPCLRPVRLTNRLQLTSSTDSRANGFSFGILVRPTDHGPRRRQALASLAGLLLTGLSSCGHLPATRLIAHNPSTLLATAAIDTARLETTPNELNLSGQVSINGEASDAPSPVVDVTASLTGADLKNIRPGAPTTVTTLTYPNKVFCGRIDRIIEAHGAGSRTLKVRVTLDTVQAEAEGYPLKPDMFANISVTYAGNDQRIAIPAGSVLFDNDRNYVIAITRENQPVVREIDIYKTVGQTTYLTGGLAAGDRILASSQFLMYNALGD